MHNFSDSPLNYHNRIIWISKTSLDSICSPPHPPLKIPGTHWYTYSDSNLLFLDYPVVTWSETCSTLSQCPFHLAINIFSSSASSHSSTVPLLLKFLSSSLSHSSSLPFSSFSSPFLFLFLFLFCFLLSSSFSLSSFFLATFLKIYSGICAQWASTP